MTVVLRGGINCDLSCVVQGWAILLLLQDRGGQAVQGALQKGSSTWGEPPLRYCTSLPGPFVNAGASMPSDKVC